MMNNTNSVTGIFIDSGFFLWHVADRGYIWDDGPATVAEFNDTVLIANPQSSSYKNYYPLDDKPALFLEFAEIEPTRDNILKFVNEYGLLTETFYDDFKDTNRWLIRADGLKFLKNAVWTMRSVVHLWNLLKNNNLNELKNIIHWETGNTNEITRIRFEYVIDNSAGKRENRYAITPVSNPQVFPRFTAEDPILPTRVLLQRIINKQLAEYPVNPRLLLDDNNKLRPYAFPTSLLSAMWYQFYQAVASGNKRFEKCDYCGKWEDITDKSPHWKYHGDCGRNARTKKSWIKKNAKILYNSGHSISDIAKRFKVESAYIERLLASGEHGAPKNP